MSSLTWPIFIIFLIFHANAKSSSSEDSSSSSSGESSSREKDLSKEKHAAESGKPTAVLSLDGSAVASQNAMQPSEKSNIDSLAPATSAAPGPAPLGPSTAEPTPQPTPSTTDSPGVPRAPPLSGLSFFIGLMVGFTVVGLVFAGIRLWMRRRAERRIPYAIY